MLFHCSIFSSRRDSFTKVTSQIYFSWSLLLMLWLILPPIVRIHCPDHLLMGGRLIVQVLIALIILLSHLLIWHSRRVVIVNGALRSSFAGSASRLVEIYQRLGFKLGRQTHTSQRSLALRYVFLIGYLLIVFRFEGANRVYRGRLFA